MNLTLVCVIVASFGVFVSGCESAVAAAAYQSSSASSASSASENSPSCVAQSKNSCTNEDSVLLSISDFESQAASLPEKGSTCVVSIGVSVWAGGPFNYGNSWSSQRDEYAAVYSCNGRTSQRVPGFPNSNAVSYFGPTYIDLYKFEQSVSYTLDYFAKRGFELKHCDKEGYRYTCIFTSPNMSR